MKWTLWIFMLSVPGLPVHGWALTPEECDVWQRELSFAQSVEKHDAALFAAHLHPGAVFSAGTESPVRGREAVVKAWAGIVEGKSVKLRWHPDVVNIGGDNGIAISTGPFILEDRKPDGSPRYLTGRFTSVWVKRGREWVVLFDGGGPPPTEVKDASTAEAYLAKAPRSCPAQ